MNDPREQNYVHDLGKSLSISRTGLDYCVENSETKGCVWFDPEQMAALIVYLKQSGCIPDIVTREAKEDMLNALTHLADDASSIHRTSPPDYAWSECLCGGEKGSHEANCVVQKAYAVVNKYDK